MLPRLAGCLVDWLAGWHLMRRLAGTSLAARLGGGKTCWAGLSGDAHGAAALERLAVLTHSYVAAYTQLLP